MAKRNIKLKVWLRFLSHIKIADIKLQQPCIRTAVHIRRIILVEPAMKYISVSKEARVKPLKTPIARKLDFSMAGFGAFGHAKFKEIILNVSSTSPLHIKHVKKIQEIVFRVKISIRNKKNWEIIIGTKEISPSTKAKHTLLKFKLFIHKGKIIPERTIGKKHKKICK